jgi:hypothetical protein
MPPFRNSPPAIPGMKLEVLLGVDANANETDDIPEHCHFLLFRTGNHHSARVIEFGG